LCSDRMGCSTRTLVILLVIIFVNIFLIDSNRVIGHVLERLFSQLLFFGIG
jgi:hypothetical protein